MIIEVIACQIGKRGGKKIDSVEPMLIEPAVKREVVPDTSPGTEKILLVEDDDSVRELAREILEMNGYTVLEACDGIEALSVFEVQCDAIDLMVTVENQGPRATALLAAGQVYLSQRAKALRRPLVSVTCGYFPATYYGLSPWLGLLLGALVLVLILMIFGRRSDPTQT